MYAPLMAISSELWLQGAILSSLKKSEMELHTVAFQTLSLIPFILWLQYLSPLEQARTLPWALKRMKSDFPPPSFFVKHQGQDGGGDQGGTQPDLPGHEERKTPVSGRLDHPGISSAPPRSCSSSLLDASDSCKKPSVSHQHMFLTIPTLLETHHSSSPVLLPLWQQLLPWPHFLELRTPASDLGGSQSHSSGGTSQSFFLLRASLFLFSHVLTGTIGADSSPLPAEGAGRQRPRGRGRDREHSAEHGGRDAREAPRSPRHDR